MKSRDICAICRGSGELICLSCPHIVCRECIGRLFRQGQGLYCDLCQAWVAEHSPLSQVTKTAPVLCLFEKQGKGKCTHGADCPRSHDPALLAPFWPVSSRPLVPVSIPVIPLVTPESPPQARAQSKSFVINTYFAQDENKKTEFKASTSQRFEVQLTVHMLAKYICAFLNTQGGVLYYGITDDHVVRGLILSANQRDRLRLAIDSCCNSFSPEVDTDKVKLRFDRVINPDGSECKETYVVVIRVRKGDPGQIYFTPDHKAWCRREASIRELRSAALVAFIKKKLAGEAEEDSDEEANKRPAPVFPSTDRAPLWEYYSSDREMWTEYPEDIQQQLESDFSSQQAISYLNFRGEQSVLDLKWMRESQSHTFYEVRRVDMRNMGQGKWWTQIDERLHYFDDRTNQALDDACMTEKPDSEVYIDSYIYYVNFERMRLSADMPLWRHSSP